MTYIKHSAVVVEDGTPRVENAQEGVATSQPSTSHTIPPQAVPWLMGLVGVAMVTARAAPAGHPAQVIADAFMDVAVLFGLASGGWQRRR